MSKILELVKATETAEAERQAAEAVALQALLEARLADARTLLESEVIGEYDIEVMRHDIDAAVLRIAPRVWRGLAHFNMVTFRPGNWQVKMEGAGDGFYVGSAEDWSQPYAVKFLVALHRQFERQHVSEVERFASRLVGSYADADEAHAMLMKLAPERAAEWDAALAGRRQREEREAAEKRVAAEARRQAFEAYLAALVEFREAYRAARAANRAAFDELKARVERPISVRDIEYAIVAQDDEGGRQAETRIVTAYAASGELIAGNGWTVIENGRSRAWVFRTVTRVSAAYEARPDQTEYSHLFLRRYNSFDALAFTERDEDEVKAVFAAMSWPEEPRPSEFGVFDFSNEERRRIDDVLGRADEPAEHLE